jgi:alpha-tubulin suppressor-like RCC1 family protein
VVRSPFLQAQSVVQVACGSAHTVAVTSTGAVLAWGWGHFGQLGNGTTANSLEPARVVGLEAVSVYRVACGSAHSAVVSDTGQLYTWGWGVNGQLGHGDDSTYLVPTLVKRLQTVYVSHVSCGLAHTVAVSEVDKQVYSWGWDQYGQLGQGAWDIFGANKHRMPRPIRDLQGRNIKSTACGSSHTLALSSSGQVCTSACMYVWYTHTHTHKHTHTLTGVCLWVGP